MANDLFMFRAEGVAGEASSKRAGARHAMMIFVSASSEEAAHDFAMEKVKERGWQFVEVKQSKQISDDVSGIADDVLRSVAQSACDNGLGLVIYKDEIPPHS